MPKVYPVRLAHQTIKYEYKAIQMMLSKKVIGKNFLAGRKRKIVNLYVLVTFKNNLGKGYILSICSVNLNIGFQTGAEVEGVKKVMYKVD